MSIGESMQQQAEEFRNRYTAVKEQIGHVIVGHDEIVHGVLTCLFVGGHACWKACRAWARRCWSGRWPTRSSLDFNRIQFTPDLMPADILGTNMIMENADGRRVFEFQQGPIFTQICLADEINRATPKTQSALLEAMQEHRHRRRRPLQAQGAVLRDGDAEPDRAGRDLSAARSPARPVLLQAGRRLLEPRGADDDPRPHDPGRRRSSPRR